MNNKTLISLRALRKLIFFILLLPPFACNNPKENAGKKIRLIWRENHATGIAVAKHLLNGIGADSVPAKLKIKLHREDPGPAIAGQYTIKGDSIIFEPLIPFTRGLVYEVFIGRQLYDTVSIPRAAAIPELLAMYPSADSLPGNLLKMYLLFSRPMQEGHSLQYIKLTDGKGDSLPGIFLEMPSELWNPGRTMLTLWLHPGRIKRGLQPNKLLGPPLVKGRQYAVVISKQWPDEEGETLAQEYTKKIITVPEDRQSPSVDKWQIIPPVAGSTRALEVRLDEPLDYILLTETISITGPHGAEVSGTIQIPKGEKLFYFTPSAAWKPGDYKLLVEARLADLAGNSMNRLFDVDLTHKPATLDSKKIFERVWKVE